MKLRISSTFNKYTINLYRSKKFNLIRQLMNFIHSTRIKIAITVLVLSALFSSMNLLRKQIVSFSRQVVGQDFASVKVKRYRGIKDALPPYGVVGYLSNVRAESMFDNNAKMAGYFAAQYTLAPVVISYSTDEKLVIGDFINIRDARKIYSKMGLVPLKKFNNGLLLLHRESE